MSRKHRYRILVTVYSTVLFMLLFALVHHHPPHKMHDFNQHSFLHQNSHHTPLS